MKFAWSTVAMATVLIGASVALDLTHHDVPQWVGVLISSILLGGMPQAVSTKGTET